jgi:hypothetical protein
MGISENFKIFNKKIVFGSSQIQMGVRNTEHIDSRKQEEAYTHEDNTIIK